MDKLVSREEKEEMKIVEGLHFRHLLKKSIHLSKFYQSTSRTSDKKNEVCFEDNVDILLNLAECFDVFAEESNTLMLV